MAGCLYDYSIDDFLRNENESDDSKRLQRAIDACGDGRVLYIPRGTYEIAAPVKITNGCSLLMHKSAVLKAVAEMNYVLAYDSPEVRGKDYNIFISGGVIDGKGLASCLFIDKFSHFTLKDITLYNGKKYGLRSGNEVKGENSGYELIASNVYCKCNMSGLAGNTGISIGNGDSHFVDCIVVNYTIGIDVAEGSCRLMRCHVWGGMPEMLVDSINFRVTAPDAVLTDCYADTGAIGFQIKNDTRLKGSGYFNNSIFKLDEIVMIDHCEGELSVTEGYFTQCGNVKATLYRGTGENLYWNNCHIKAETAKLEEPVTK